MAERRTGHTGQPMESSMKNLTCLLFAFVLPLSAVAGGKSQGLKSPQVVQFIGNAEACEHFAGEWDPEMSKREKRVIERNVDKYCGLAQKQKAQLLPKFKNDMGVLQALNQYESVTDYAPTK